MIEDQVIHQLVERVSIYNLPVSTLLLCNTFEAVILRNRQGELQNVVAIIKGIWTISQLIFLAYFIMNTNNFSYKVIGIVLSSVDEI